ncbi:hypothetical protein FACS1894217_15730 [Clostridia bacterium]|nr:hypothetical protein FACS1894217_15730 [Clostridia bacterium]
MTFSEFAQMLYPFCGDGKLPSDFVVALIGSIIEDTEDDRPLLDFKPDYLKRIYNGKRTISQQNATFVVSHLDKNAFVDFICNRPDAAIEGLCVALSAHGISVTKHEAANTCADLFAEILTVCANGTILGRGSSDMEIAEELSPDLTKLRVLLAKLPHPETLIPPNEFGEDELPYVTELLAAYADAEGLDELTKDELEKYVKYKKNLQRQRKDYYAAESVRRGTREAFGDADPDQFETLKNETHDGIVEVHERDYDHGFDRLNAVMSQVALVPISKCVLRETDWIGNSEKKGVCHFLVNDGRIKWVDDDE